VDYVVGTAVRPAVVNMSINGPNSESQVMRDAIRGVMNAGISFMWSAGNHDPGI
jgi:hypothetical protein